MKRRSAPGLSPLGASARPERSAGGLEERLRRAWLLVVGPALVHRTRLLRIHHDVLLVGCWYPELVPSLRSSVQAIWPQLQTRLERFWHRRFRGIEIVPCDPPPAPARPPAKAVADPLLQVLERLRRHGSKEG